MIDDEKNILEPSAKRMAEIRLSDELRRQEEKLNTLKNELEKQIQDSTSELARIRGELESIVNEARKYAEDIIETIREPLLVLNSDLGVISANRNLYLTFDTSPKETEGYFIYDLGNKQWNTPQLRKLFESILPEKTAFNDYEVSHDFEKLGHRTMLINARQIYRGDIGQRLILVAIEDITDRKLAENKLRDTIKKLEDANEDLDAFSYSASHDLRAPLRRMSSFVGLMQKRLTDHPDDKLRDYADAIARSAKKMDTLISDLLTFSHMSRIEMQSSKVDMDALVRNIVSEVMSEAKGRNIAWEIDMLPAIYGDKAMLRLMLVNLISNAVKYTRTRSKAEIGISCKESGDEFVCSVRDNGVGFDMAHVGKLFGVFQRLHTQNEFEGTGIGLANVRRIISRHGGRTWAEGIEGKGATFYFALPKGLR